MKAFFSAISVILSFAVVIGNFWSVIGVPVGIILFILKRFNKFHASNKKIFWWCFGGVVLISAAFVLYFIVSLIQGLLGVTLTGSLPAQP